MRLRTSLCVLAAWTVMALLAPAAAAQSSWREAFQSSPATYEAPSEVFLEFANQNWRVPREQLLADLTPQPVEGTVRYQVTVLAEGSQIRLRLSNEEGRTPLTLNAVTVGLVESAFVAQAGSLRPVTFGGSSVVTIPAGAPVVSDPIDLPVAAGSQLVISMALAGQMMNEGRGGNGFLVAAGNQVFDAALEGSTPSKGRPLVSGVSVLTDDAPNVIVAFGDSITDGNRVEPGVLHGWPEQLGRRLSHRPAGQRYNVVNAGISGNRLLAPGWGEAGLARLDRDALRIEGITHLILLEGINDINFSGQSPFGNNPELSADDLIAGYRQVIARAHERGVKVYIGTLTPYPPGEINGPTKVAIREAVNRWIRESGEPDAVIDFDAMLRDRSRPDQFGAEHDSGDHLHPSEAGYVAMGNGIDLSLFP